MQPGYLFIRPVALRPQVSLGLPLQSGYIAKFIIYKNNCQIDTSRPEQFGSSLKIDKGLIRIRLVRRPSRKDNLSLSIQNLLIPSVMRLAEYSNDLVAGENDSWQQEGTF
jgi:hypothetical protein